MDEDARVPGEERDLFRSLVDHSLGLMCVHDLEGNLLFVNTAAAETLGFRPEDGIGWNLRRFLSPAAEDEFDAYLERIRANGVDSGRMSLVSKDGRRADLAVPERPPRSARDARARARPCPGRDRERPGRASPQGERAALPAPREHDAGPHLDVGPERLMHLREPALARFHRAAGGGASRRRVDRQHPPRRPAAGHRGVRHGRHVPGPVPGGVSPAPGRRRVPLDDGVWSSPDRGGWLLCGAGRLVRRPHRRAACARGARDRASPAGSSRSACSPAESPTSSTTCSP